jgi:uncharacterized protein YoaH (UPF0181 family)
MRHAGSLRSVVRTMCKLQQAGLSSGQALAIIVAPNSARQPHESTA